MTLRLRARSCEAPALCECLNIPRAMDDANDHNGVRKRFVVDGIRAMKRDAQAWRELLAQGTGQRKMPQRFEMRLDGPDKPVATASDATVAK